MSPDAIDLTRLEDGVCLDCNQSYLDLYGYAREEVIGHSTLPGDLGIWAHGEDRARHVAELLGTGHAFDFETTLRRRDGRTLVGLIASSVIEVDGQPCNLSLTRDITERKRTEEVLRESARRLELALASNHLGIWGPGPPGRHGDLGRPDVRDLRSGTWHPDAQLHELDRADRPSRGRRQAGVGRAGGPGRKASLRPAVPHRAPRRIRAPRRLARNGGAGREGKGRAHHRHQPGPDGAGGGGAGGGGASRSRRTTRRSWRAWAAWPAAWPTT